MPFVPQNPLRSWLRQEPQPHHVRIRTGDDEVRIVTLNNNPRRKWADAEKSILSYQAVHVECLDEKDNVIRAQDLEFEDEEGELEPVSWGGGKGKRAQNAATHEEMRRRAVIDDRRETAAMFDRYGDKMCLAFKAGAEAASSSQENLVSLVEVLTTHLGIAITNLHNVSVNLANVHAQREGVEDPGIGGNADLIKQLLGAAALKAVGSGTMGGAPPKPAPPNGAKP